MSDRSPAGEMLTIGSMAKRFGVTHRTLRFYERKGLIAPQRLGRHRLYSHSDVMRFARIHAWASAGLRLAEISKMLVTGEDPNPTNCSEHLKRRLDEIEASLQAQLAALKALRATL